MFGIPFSMFTPDDDDEQPVPDSQWHKTLNNAGYRVIDEPHITAPPTHPNRRPK